MTTDEQTVWQRRECVSADVEGSLVLLDVDTLVYHALNRTASAIWLALEQPSTIAAIASRLENQFEVDPQHCRQSVTRLLAELEANKLVTPH